MDYNDGILDEAVLGDNFSQSTWMHIQINHENQQTKAKLPA